MPISSCAARTAAPIGFASQPDPCERLPPGWSITVTSGRTSSLPLTRTCWRPKTRSSTQMIPPTPDIRTTLVLRRTFAADRPRVFRAWIEPEALQRWLKPNGLNLRVQSLDARVDGSFQFDLENGTSIIGTYLDLVPPEKLVFTWINQAQPEQGTVVTVDFREQGS